MIILSGILKTGKLEGIKTQITDLKVYGVQDFLQS